MKKRIFSLGLLATAVLALMVMMPTAALAGDNGKRARKPRLEGRRVFPTDRIIVRFRARTKNRVIKQFLESESAVSFKKRKRQQTQYVVRMPDGVDTVETATRWAAEDIVKWAQADMRRQVRKRVIPNDTEFSGQWAFHNTGQLGSLSNRDVYAEQAWDITMGDSSIVIALLDDGVQMSHPDLSGSIFENTAETGGTFGFDDDGNGYVDDVRGWDFYHSDTNPAPVVDEDNHGTLMAGYLAAQANNGMGIAGMASGCRVMPIRVVSRDIVVADSVVADAIEYAADMADSISISLAIDPIPVIRDALNYALVNGRDGRGCVISVAFGNDGIIRRYSSDIAAFPEVIGVSGTSNYDRRSYFSDFGPPLDMVAPGGGGNVDVITTDRTGGLGASPSEDYARVRGTSVSCPLVAGAAALIMSEHPTWSGLQIRRQLERTCDKIDTESASYDERGWSSEYGYGRLNAWAALSYPEPHMNQYESNNTANAAAEIRDGELQYHALNEPTDIDWAFFDVTNRADVEVSVIGTSNTILQVYSNATMLAEDDTGLYNLVAVSNLPPGRYHVMVAGRSGVTVSNYGLHLAFINLEDAYEDDDTRLTASPIALGELTFRTLYPEADHDWAQFTLTEDCFVQIRTSGEWAGDTELWLRDSAGTQLAYNDDEILNTNRYSYIGTQLVAGVYYAEVKDYYGEQWPVYQLIVEAYADDPYEPDDDSTQAVAIVSGEKSMHTLWPSNDVDWMTFTLTNPANILVRTDSPNTEVDTDTELTLYRLEDGSNLLWVGYDDNGNGGGITFSALYSPDLVTGTYMIKVEGRTGAELGPNYFVALDVFEKKAEVGGASGNDGDIELSWQGDATHDYCIQSADYLGGTWSTVTNYEGRTGANVWRSGPLPEPSGTSTQRFYRLVVE